MSIPKDVIAGLIDIDTPTITNAVATYPKSPTCLGLYNPWTENWYTDASLRCCYPEMKPVIGRVVTCVYGLPDPNFSGRLSFLDVIDALEAAGSPTILAIEQKWPLDLASKAGLVGEIMVTAMKAVGCVGLISNGPSRDVDAIRHMDFQMLLTGISAGHGEMAIQSINAPVSICGMDVAPNEMIHMDENGAVKFPQERATAVLAAARSVLAAEEPQLTQLRKATSAKDVRAALTTYKP